MNWYYVEDGQQAGPVDDAQLAELRASGKVQEETLVWREGMANWQPYREVASASTPAADAPPVLSDAPVPAIAGGVVCCECGGTFPPDQAIRYQDRWVCARCKPVFFQRLQEGAALIGIPGAVTDAEVLARDYEVDIGGYLTRSWELFKAHAGIMIGASVLVYLCLIAINIVPYLSTVLALILTGPLMGGLWCFYFKLVRSEEASLSDAFSGFGPRFWQLFLVQLIPSLVAFGFVIVLVVIGALGLPAFFSSRGSETSSVFGVIALTVFGLFLLIFVVVMVYLNVCWMFAVPLAADKGLRFWPALELSRKVVNKHWWMTLLLAIVCGILAMAGALACLVGLLVTGPVAFAMVAAHYQKVFGDLAPEI